MILACVEYIFLRFIKQLSSLEAIHCYAPEGFKMDYLGKKEKKKKAENRTREKGRSLRLTRNAYSQF